jgi:hypothetical protein
LRALADRARTEWRGPYELHIHGMPVGRVRELVRALGLDPDGRMAIGLARAAPDRRRRGVLGVARHD